MEAGAKRVSRSGSRWAGLAEPVTLVVPLWYSRVTLVVLSIGTFEPSGAMGVGGWDLIKKKKKKIISLWAPLPFPIQKPRLRVSLGYHQSITKGPLGLLIQQKLASHDGEAKSRERSWEFDFRRR